MLETPKRRDVIQNPERPAVSRDDHVVVLDDQVANRRRGHVELERIPVRAVIAGEVHPLLGAREKQTAVNRILSDHVGDAPVRDAVVDLAPGPSAVMGLEEVRTKILEAERVAGHVRRQRIEMAGVDDRHLAPWPRAKAGWRNVLPRAAAVARDVNESVVGPRPDPSLVDMRRRDGVDNTRMPSGRRTLGAVLADVSRDDRVRPCKVARYLRPALPAVEGPPDHVGAEIERSRIDGGEYQRCRA